MLDRDAGPRESFRSGSRDLGFWHLPIQRGIILVTTNMGTFVASCKMFEQFYVNSRENLSL